MLMQSYHLCKHNFFLLVLKKSVLNKNSIFCFLKTYFTIWYTIFQIFLCQYSQGSASFYELKNQCEFIISKSATQKLRQCKTVTRKASERGH